MNKLHPLYRAACAADDALNAELIRVFGLTKACDARYRPQSWPAGDDALFAAALVKHNADRAWRVAMGGVA